MNQGFSPKELRFGKDGRDKLISGITKLSNAVKSTLGPQGNTVLIESEEHIHCYIIGQEKGVALQYSRESGRYQPETQIKESINSKKFDILISGEYEKSKNGVEIRANIFQDTNKTPMSTFSINSSLDSAIFTNIEKMSENIVKKMYAINK